jgi:hypothetical protein
MEHEMHFAIKIGVIESPKGLSILPVKGLAVMKIKAPESS